MMNNKTQFMIIFSLFSIINAYNPQYGSGYLYKTNIRQPYRDIYKTTAKNANKIKNRFLRYIYDEDNMKSYIENNDIMLLYNDFQGEDHKNIMKSIVDMEYSMSIDLEGSPVETQYAIWSPEYAYRVMGREPLAILMYRQDTTRTNDDVVVISNIVQNPSWNHNQIPLVEMKYAMESFTQTFYKYHSLDFSEVYERQPHIKDFWDCYIS